ncbi:MAG: tRNA (adenosine(37)-N6)-threonylcarbamoyltransferase complex transferase subunit TsaD [Opitutaceae bacterium]|nr:tRNA (adenosine(37)-N6)-threonylcarbamoyltransferase complex transferase subunit TsaD [Opitutaceae bacterium]
MILAVESSCDETAVALFDPRSGMRGEWVRSQIALHERYGGVVPDLATREHLQVVGPLLQESRAVSDDWRSLTQVAVTHGPGLAGCLAMGVAAAKAFALERRLPLVAVNHLRGHAFSPFIPLHQESPGSFEERLSALLPHLGLIVSGGNTLLFTIGREKCLTLISSTRDDAAGEALDKGAKLLGLGYPGGPLIEKVAKDGRSDAFDFPRGIGPRDDLDFSFSGLKTSLRYRIEKMTPGEVAARLPDLAASYQQAVIDALVRKTMAAFRQDNYRSLGLSGGVANNRVLRSVMEAAAGRVRVPLLAALPAHTGDNAAMIGFAAWIDPTVKVAGLAEIGIVPNLPLT